MLKFPKFETERLVLQGLTGADALSYEKHFVDYEVISQLTSVVPWPYPKGGVLDFIQKQVLPRQGHDRWTWGIFLKSNSNELIGSIELWREGKPEHRGFWLARKYWGQGIMSEAVVPIMDYVFDVLGFETLIFSNAVGNLKSRRIKEKTGARLVRIEPAKFVNPDYTEHEIWELSKSDWKAFKQRNII